MNRIITTVLLSAVCACAWGQEATIGIGSAGATTFTPGEVVTLDLTGSNFAVPLDGAGLNLSFNPAVLYLQSVAINSHVFDTTVSSGTIDNAAGTLNGIDVFEFFGSSPVGNFDIASLTFVAGKAGSADLALSGDGLGFASGGKPLVPGTDFQFQAQKISVSSMVAPVPEPPTLWLLAGVALAALSMRRWIPALQ